MNNLKNGQKIRLLILLDILRQETDENHKLTTNELIERLEKKGTACDRKTLYNDVDVLNEFGYEVMFDKSQSKNYYVVNRDFEIPELRILIDAVQAAGFITPKKSGELVDKIARLAGLNKAKVLKNTTTCNIVKHQNESIYYNVSAIDEGLSEGKKISFVYFDYDDLGKRVYRHDKARYVVNPLSLMINDNFYYLSAYNDKDEEVRTYRVDRMEEVRCTDEPFSEAALETKFIPEKMRKATFSMFSGEEKRVEIEFDSTLIDAVKDKFGQPNISVRNGKLKIYEDIEVSPTFFGWCSQFGDKIKILSPDVATEYTDYLKSILKRYEE